MANASRNGIGFTFQTPTVAQSSFSHHFAPGLYTNPMASRDCFYPGTSSSGLIQFPSPDAYKVSSSMSSTLGSMVTTNSAAYLNSSAAGPLGLPSSWHPTVPGSMPWSISPLTTANLMRFSATSTMPSMQTLTFSNGLNLSPVCSVIRPSASTFYPNTQKRKVEDVDKEAVSSKVYINEDRMAARMQEMHLDNNNLEWHPNLEEDTSWYQTPLQRQQQLTNTVPSAYGQSSHSGVSPASPSSSSDEEDAKTASSKSRVRTLELAKELQLNIRTQEILPKVILDEISRPQMQVVLWQPQPDFIKGLVPHRSPDGATSLGCLSDILTQSNDATSVTGQSEMEPEDRNGLRTSLPSGQHWNVAPNRQTTGDGGGGNHDNAASDCYALDLNFEIDDDDDMEL